MKTLIVCVSVSNGNTRKVAEAMADVLGTTVMEPEEVDAAAIESADLIAVGSGIYAMSFHPRLRTFVRRLPKVSGKRAVVFWTSGGPELPLLQYSKGMVRDLRAKGFDVAGTFSCCGWDTWLPLRVIGGLNKGRPNAGDLDEAREFAARFVEAAEKPAGKRRGQRRLVAG